MLPFRGKEDVEFHEVVGHSPDEAADYSNMQETHEVDLQEIENHISGSQHIGRRFLLLLDQIIRPEKKSLRPNERIQNIDSV